MELKELVIESEKLAKKEIEENSFPNPVHYELAMQKGIELAKKYNANIEIVKIGLMLMDIKLGEAMKNGVVEKHIDMSVEKAKEILSKFNISDEMKEKVINCVEAHHGTKKYTCIEAEICANADCYRFIHPKGVFVFCTVLGLRFNDLNKVLEQLEYKMDEKYNIISLNEVKKELENYYKQFKELLNVSKL